MAAIATGFLLARAVAAFPIEPLGEVTPVAKYTHNTAFLIGSGLLGLGAIACGGRSGRGEGMDRDHRPMPDLGTPGT